MSDEDFKAYRQRLIDFVMVFRSLDSGFWPLLTVFAFNKEFMDDVEKREGKEFTMVLYIAVGGSLVVSW